MGRGRDFLKYFKRGWNRKEATRIKTVKTESKLRLGVGAFKKGGWIPLRNYDVLTYMLENEVYC